MRNVLSIVATAVLVGFATVGCDVDQPPAADNPQLSSASRAVSDQQSDRAIESADQYLRSHPDGLGAAEALYLKGRGLEEKTAGDPAELKRNLLEARISYADALEKHPSPKTEGYIRASLSNVAFNQEDYPTTLAEASRAYTLIQSPAIQAVLLFRMGVSEQRMGRFTDADRTLQLVVSRYGGTSVARSAKERIGLRQFYVQLATYNSAAGADRAIASTPSGAILISKHPDASGHTLIDAGPFPTFEAASDAKSRFDAQFPTALIIP